MILTDGARVAPSISTMLEMIGRDMIMMTTTRTRWRRSGAELLAHLPDGRIFVFCRPGGGYVYCDLGDSRRHGTLGSQICAGGSLRGATIVAVSDDAMAREARAWLRSYLRGE